MTSKTTSSDNLTMPMTEHEPFQVRVDAADEMYRIEAADEAEPGLRPPPSIEVTPVHDLGRCRQRRLATALASAKELASTAVTARHEPPQGPGARTCQSCASFGAIAISGVLSRLADINGRLRQITAPDEAAPCVEPRYSARTVPGDVPLQPDPGGSPHNRRLHRRLDEHNLVLAVALALWMARDDSRAESAIRQAANTALAAIYRRAADLIPEHGFDPPRITGVASAVPYRQAWAA
jgi:hypothetical protein